ncbi:MAG: hypothetical protein HY729_09435 [Candidatus Rokubacteria bacterium]|nr:hypothetical protein [Candidatus Rokubacteria bacterium]MBI4628921.1 hypothetical protein [Candidatus Rokubacteria bacterium]
MEGLLFIVSQERRDLYEALRQLLVNEKAVEVVLDRRVMKRRQRQEPPAAERRRFGRRTRPREEAEVHARGWTVVRLP